MSEPIKKVITYEQNGGEYLAEIVVHCSQFVQIDKNAIEVNGAVIRLDEEIVSVEDSK